MSSAHPRIKIENCFYVCAILATAAILSNTAACAWLTGKRRRSILRVRQKRISRHVVYLPRNSSASSFSLSTDTASWSGR